MIKKQRLSHSKNSKPYWSVLAYDGAEYKPLVKPNNFMSLLQAQYKNVKTLEKGKPSDYSFLS